MLNAKCIRDIDLARNHDVKRPILESNNWTEFRNNIGKLNEDKFNKIKGDIFELITSLYFVNNPIYTTKLRNLWRSTNIPIQILDLLDLKKPEIGVDLLAESNDGTFWAIQCKYKQDIKDNISYGDLRSFFSITERPQTRKSLSLRLISCSTLDVSKQIFNANHDNLGLISYSEFSQVEEEDFEKYKKILNNEKITLEKFKPKPHQQRALDKCLDYFLSNSRGKLIHPCGAGKSLTGYWLFRYLNAKNALVVVPSLQLVKQTLKTWARELICEGIEVEWIAICSDDDVKNLDDPSISITDLGIEVNTEINEISKFINQKTEKLKLIITTYQSGNTLINALKESGYEFELGIFDEAHKTVGSKKKPFAQLLYEDKIKIKKRLFMTATERNFKGNSEEIISMDDERIYGSVIDELSFKSALEQKDPILTDYKIVSASVSKKEINQMISNNEFIRAGNNKWTYEADSSTFAALITLRKMIKKHNLKHIISFHKSIKRAKDFKYLNEEINTICSDYGVLHSFHISGKDSTGTRTDMISRFTNNDPSLITNARCLTEGVDIPQVDAVLFADPKQSKVDIVQAVGRAMRNYENKQTGYKKKLGYIIIPIMLDGDNQDSITENAFNDIISVVSAIGMSDERIIAEFQEIAKGKRSLTKNFELDFELPVGSIKLQSLYEGIELKIWDRLSFAKSFVEVETFARWMRNETKLSEKTIKNYMGGFKRISNDLLKMKPQYSSISDLINNEDLYTLKEDWLSVPENKKLNTIGKDMYGASFNQFIKYAKFTYYEEKNKFL